MITIDGSDFFRPHASRVEKALALRSFLDNLISLNQVFLHYHPGIPGLYQSGTYYKRDTIWRPIPSLYANGFGDCKSLACALIAEYRLVGIQAEPTFRFLPPFFEGTQFEYTLFHILVQTPTGYDDPSKELGMLAQDYQPFYSSDAVEQ